MGQDRICGFVMGSNGHGKNGILEDSQRNSQKRAFCLKTSVIFPKEKAPQTVWL
jgi:hypothetical protein